MEYVLSELTLLYYFFSIVELRDMFQEVSAQETCLTAQPLPDCRNADFEIMNSRACECIEFKSESH